MICWKCGFSIPENEGHYIQVIEGQPTITLCIGCEGAWGWIFSELEYVAPKNSELSVDSFYSGLAE